jgi:hypothetical protein
MQKPIIADFNSTQRQELIANIKQSALNTHDQEAIIEALGFCNELMEKLKTSAISVNKLKELLLGFKSEQQKKQLQTH